MSDIADPQQLMAEVDVALSHVWMVRTFIKHCEEAEEDDELQEVHRGLYDFMLALGGPLQAGNGEAYLKQAKKKLGKLRKTVELFAEIQPEISDHTNFKMASASLQAAFKHVERLLTN